jgi:hypothetical protein
MYLSKEKKSMLEGGASTNLFTCENKLVFERNTACLSGFSRGRKAHLFKIGLFK